MEKDLSTTTYMTISDREGPRIAIKVDKEKKSDSSWKGGKNGVWFKWID